MRKSRIVSIASAVVAVAATVCILISPIVVAARLGLALVALLVGALAVVAFETLARLLWSSATQRRAVQEVSRKLTELAGDVERGAYSAALGSASPGPSRTALEYTPVSSTIPAAEEAAPDQDDAVTDRNAFLLETISGIEGPEWKSLANYLYLGSEDTFPTIVGCRPLPIVPGFVQESIEIAGPQFIVLDVLPEESGLWGALTSAPKLFWQDLARLTSIAREQEIPIYGVQMVPGQEPVRELSDLCEALFYENGIEGKSQSVQLMNPTLRSQLRGLANRALQQGPLRPEQVERPSKS